MNSFLKSFPTTKTICRTSMKEAKGRSVKLINSSSKSSVGPVISEKPKGDEKQSVRNVAKSENAYKSEMFWMLGNRWNEIVRNRKPKIVDYSKPAKGKSSVNVNGAKQFELLQSNPITPQEEIPSNVNSPRIQKTSIPFSDEELKSFLTHPLVTDVEIDTSPSMAVGMRSIPSVGKILQATMSEAARNALINWKRLKLLELGEQGFAELQQANLNSGHAFHSSLQTYFHTNESPLAESPVYKVWESVSGVLGTLNTPPALVEKSVYHPTLKYKGICDCVSDVGDQLTLIEWKKSGRSKPTLASTYDAPLQLCAYLGALHSMPEYKGRIRQGMVVVAYENGEKADVYKLNEIMLRQYWRSWLARLQEFWIRSRDGTLPEPI